MLQSILDLLKQQPVPTVDHIAKKLHTDRELVRAQVSFLEHFQLIDCGKRVCPHCKKCRSRR